MLINSIVLFLRDALPVLILFSLVLVLYRGYAYRFRIALGAVVCGLVASLGLVLSMGFWSALADGMGLELLYAGLYAIAFLLIGALLIHKRGSQPGQIKLVFALCTLLVCLGSSSIFVYFLGFWQHIENPQVILLGSFMGGAISLSVAVLWYYLLTMLDHYWAYASRCFLALFAAGLTGRCLAYLIQADWLPYSATAWNSSTWVSDSSELGHFLHAIFGYEATPHWSQITVFLSALALLLGMVWVRRTREQQDDGV